MLRRPFAEPLAALAFAVLASTPGPVRAAAPPAPTDAEVALARDRFAEARTLEEAGRWAEALALFQRVAEVKTTPQVRFHIALCMENVGLWTQALDGYAQAVEEAGPAAPDVVKEANEHLRKLGPTLPTVSLHVAGAVAGDELLLDRRRLPLDDRPLPLRADPGPHTAEVRRDGAVVARAFFTLEARSTRHVELRVGTVASEHGEGPPAVAPDDASPPRGRTQRALGWTAIGVGGASIALAGVFIGLRADAMSRLTAACPSFTQCPGTVASIVGDGKTDAMLVNVFGVLGGVATAAGVALLLVPPRHAPPPAGGVASGARRGGVELGVALGADGHVALRGVVLMVGAPWVSRWAVLVGLLGLAGLGACAFPDVGYADGGAGAGGACGDLASCTAAATSCASTADDQHTTCSAACKNGNPGCTSKCDQDQNSAHMACVNACAMVCAAGCASAPAACAAAVGP